VSAVLLLSAGRRVSLLRGFQEVMAARGGRALAGDMRPHLSAACQIAEASFALPHVLSEAYPAALHALCRAQDIRLVVPTIDTELGVLAELRPAFARDGIALAVSDPALVADCADKRRTARLFADHGLATPALYDPGALCYPVLVKPYDGALSAGVHLLRDPGDLTEQIRTDPKNIFCQYIDHATHAEYTVDLYYSRTGRLCCVVPRRRIEVRGGEVAKGLAEKNEIVALLFGALGQLPGARGCLTLQLFRHRETGAHWCIEINPRFGGGYPLSRHAGADFQAWLVREYLDGTEPAEFHDWRDGTLMLRYDGEIIVDGYTGPL